MKIALDKLRLPEKDLRAAIDREALEELADSMKEHGQLQPIGVRRLHDDIFEVVFGARRTRAATLLGWETINAALTELGDDTATASAKLIENVQRENLTPIEEAYGILELIGDEEPNFRQLQRQTGKSREWIRSRLALTLMPDDIQQAVQAGAVSQGVAKALATIENDEIRKQYLEYAAENNITADDAARWAAQAAAAATGQTVMQHFEEDLLQQREDAPVVYQMWNCFLCREANRQIDCSMHVICRGCLGTISKTRETVTAAP